MNLSQWQTCLEAKIVVQIVSVVDNSRVKSVSILNDDVVNRLGDHWCHAACRRVVIVEQIVHHV